MRAIARLQRGCKEMFKRRGAGRPADRQRRFYQARCWETTCGGHLMVEEAPDRLIFAVSLVVLPLVLIL